MDEQQRGSRLARRTATVAAVVGVVAVVGGVALVRHVDDGRPRALPPSPRSAPTSEVSEKNSLPPAASLDAAALTAATGMQAHPWRKVSFPDGLISAAIASCIASTGASTSEDPPSDSPQRSGLAAFRAGDGGMAIVGLSSYPPETDLSATWNQGLSRLAHCDGERTLAADWGKGTTGLAYRLLPVGQAPQNVWVARVGQAVGLVWVQHPGAAPDQQTDSRVLDALAATLRDPTTFPKDPYDSVVGPTPGQGFGSLDPTVLSVVLGSWKTGWSGPGDPTRNHLAHLPCEDPHHNTLGGTGDGANVGVDGTSWFWQLQSEKDARAGLKVVADLLSGCAGYSVTDVSPELGHPTIVAFSPHGQVVWATQVERSVGYLILPAGATPPPHDVTVSVAGELRLALEGG